VSDNWTAALDKNRVPRSTNIHPAHVYLFLPQYATPPINSDEYRADAPRWLDYLLENLRQVSFSADKIWRQAPSQIRYLGLARNAILGFY